ncbi:MAG: sulfotransferase [Pseudomonadota bacterium]
MTLGSFDPRFREPACLFWGIGAQKAGTTWLHHYLASHPDVKVPALFKEQHYWTSVRPPYHAHVLPKTRLGRINERVRLEILSRIRRDSTTQEWAARQRAIAVPRADHRDHATALFAGWQDETAVGEITPAYALLSPAVFGEMAALSDRSRFIFIMRDPVSRALSAARMYHNQNPAGGSVADRLEQALSGTDTLLVDQSSYDRTLDALDTAIATDRVAYFFYETLFDQTEVDRLCAFLGIAPHPAQTENVVFSFKSEDDAALPKELLKRLEQRLQPAYAAVRNRFGNKVPLGWR